MSTAKPTEAHIEMARKICGRESDSEEKEYAAQLIANSEAQAVTDKVAEIIEKNAPEIVKVNAELAAMKAENQKLWNEKKWCERDAMKAEAELAAEREKVRVLLEALEKFRHTVIAGGTKPAQAALAAIKEVTK